MVTRLQKETVIPELYWLFCSDPQQSRSQSLRYPYPAERATDALEESKTGTRESWFRFDCACVRFQDKMEAVDDNKRDQQDQFRAVSRIDSTVIDEQSENSQIYAVKANI